MTHFLLQFKPEIKGDSQIAKHKDWVRCTSFGFTANREIGPIEKRTLGGADLSVMGISRDIDKASGALFEQTLKKAKDAKLSKVELRSVEESGEINFAIVMEDVFLTMMRVSASEGAKEEVLTLDYKTITIEVGDAGKSGYDRASKELL